MLFFSDTPESIVLYLQHLNMVYLVQLNVVSIIQFFRDPRPMNCMVFDRLHPKPQLHHWQAAAIETAERDEWKPFADAAQQSFHVHQITLPPRGS